MRFWIASLFAVVALFGVLANAAEASSIKPVIYVKNLSTGVTDAQVVAATANLQIAVSRDFAPIWGVDATFETTPMVKPDEVMFIEDYSDEQGALGYHWLHDGHPYSKVFVDDSADYNDDWRLVFSHEAFEMLADPFINHFAAYRGRFYLVEVADPVESGFDAYFINGMPVSDFILPGWYRSWSGAYDFTGHLTKAGQIDRHGYVSWVYKNHWRQAVNFPTWGS